MIKMLPNEQLRRERQRRGWSRQYVAEQVGVADPKTIGRWERGVAFPSSHFLQELCALFGMLAEDLGLFPGEHDNGLQGLVSGAMTRSEYGRERASLHDVAAFPFIEPVIPALLVEVDGLVGRDELLQELRQHLRGCRSLTVSALNELPAAEKPVVTRELMYDGDIEQYPGDRMLCILFYRSKR